MSVTFWCPEAPTEKKTVTCWVCDGEFSDDQPCDFCKNTGTDEETVPVAPFTELNLANGNAQAILDIIDPNGQHPDLTGKWSGDKLSEVLSNVTRTLNTNRRELLVINDSHYGNMSSRGRDLNYVIRRLTTFQHLLKAAQEHGYRVVFS